MEPQHAPLSNIYVLLSMLGIVIGISLWALTPEWGFLFLLMSILLFVATFISAVRAPLPTDFDLELAVHEKYGDGRYPDTNLHSGLVRKGHKKYISKHKKHLVKWHISSEEAEKEAAKRKVVAKKTVKKPVVKKIFKKAIKKATKKVTRKPSTKKAVKKVSRKVVPKKAIKKPATKKKVTKKATTKKRKR